MTEDGAVLCRRVQQPGAIARYDRNGVPFYIWHPRRRHSAGWTAPPITPRPEARRGDVGVLDRVYSALLARLSLTAQHREALYKRKLNDAAINKAGYQSWPGRERVSIARELAGLFGAELLTVPGFIISERPGGKPFASIAGAGPGVLIPVRDTQARIIALKLRRDNVSEGESRYFYLSSRSRGGPGPGSPAHVPLGVPAAHTGTVRLTEGELKADIAFELSSVPTISVPGVGNWRKCLPVLRELRPITILAAWDADWQTKADVRRPLVEMLRLFVRCGFRVGVETWDAAHGKGIDDLLAAGGQPEVRWLEGGRRR